MDAVPLSRVIEIADSLFPFDNAESWDNCGIQVGDPDRLVLAAAFSLDATPRTLDSAARHSCNLLITHHPLILEPLRNIVAREFVGRTILHAAKLGVDVVSLHTNLDAAPGGLNDDLVAKLGLENVIVPLPARCARIGDLPVAMTVSAFARKATADLGLEHVHIIANEDRLVRRIFCACGSGMGYFREALNHGADLLLTGDVRYHAAREALEMGIPVVDGGHYGLERHAPGLLEGSFRAAFQEHGLDIDCVRCDVEHEPFKAML